MEEDQPDPNAVNFIPCVCFVRRGVAKENPDKVCAASEYIAEYFVFVVVTDIAHFARL